MKIFDHSNSAGTINMNKGERIISLVAGSFLLYKALRSKNSKIKKALTGAALLFRGYTGSCPFYTSMNINTTNPVSSVAVTTSQKVNKPRSEVYNFWRKLDNLPYFMEHLESVKVLDSERSAWAARVPGGLGTIDWESVIVSDEKNEYIAWKSLPNSQIENSGMVWFMDSGANATEVKVEISYKAPMGNVGALVGKLFNPLLEKMIKNDIKNFKEYMETGKITDKSGETF